MTSALLMAALVPEKRAGIFARGWQMGENRLITGVHYPSDVEAGKLLATASAGFMREAPAFKTDLAAARAELRAGLRLPLK